MNQTVNAITPVMGEKTPAFLFSGAALSGDRFADGVWIAGGDLENGLCLTRQAGDYDALAAVSREGITYAAVGKYQKGQRSICLYLCRNNQVIARKNVADLGKYDSLRLCFHGDSLYLAAEEARGDYCGIRVFVLDPATGDTLRKISVSEHERAYCPALASDGKTLFLAYESFFGERYHAMVRVLEDSGRHFSQAVEAGCDMVNDNALSLYADETGCYLTWENSSPLFDDYVWAPPEVEKPILMPSYGHGWRVFSKVMLRRLSLEKGVLSVEIPQGCDDRNAGVPVEATEDAGESCCFVHNGRLFLAFTEYAERVRYHVVLACWDGSRFVRLEYPEIKLYDRKKPVFFLDGEDLVVLDEQDDLTRRLHRISLKPVTGAIPGFRTDKAVKLNTLRGTPGYVPQPRKTAQIDGQEVQLFWGDLHMHSNISHCSRHPAFHCSNVEIKNRYSRDAGRLDFCLLTDHDSMNPMEWARTVKNADFTNMDNYFTAFLGYEWTSTQKKKFHNYGHYNVLYRHSGPMLAIDDGTCPDVEQLWSTMQPGEAMTIPHHPGELVHPLDWDYNNAEFVRLVEIYQVRGAYEYDHCDFDPLDYGRGTTPGNSVQTGLNRGYHFGFTSGGEHEGVGVTGVFARSLTRNDIFDALYQRRTYGTTSMRLYATLFVDGHFMGSDIPDAGDAVTLTGEIHGTDDIAHIFAVTDLGEREITGSYDAQSGKFLAQQSVSGAKWLYLRVKQADGNVAWTSPVFFG